MKKISNKNLKKLKGRVLNNTVRTVKEQSKAIDFSSNDYLGFANSEMIFDKTHEFLIAKELKKNGATGSRLLSGNHLLYTEVETLLSEFHQSDSATIFNSGYDANLGFFATVPQRGDVILYDELIHASIRDGIQLSHAKAFKFQHNNIKKLERQILELTKKENVTDQNIYVVTETVFSMDGDTPDLLKMAEVCKKNNAFFVVDEAHAIGVLGNKGAGIIQELHLQNDVFARIITFGKGLGCHGAAILGNRSLQQYLVNFARSFIYTTGLPPHSLATIKMAYTTLAAVVKNKKTPQEKLQENILFFKSEIIRLKIASFFIESNSAIHCCIIPGNEKIKVISSRLEENNFDVKAILAPTVPKNKERLRFCLHAYNSKKEISEVLEVLCQFNLE